MPIIAYSIVGTAFAIQVHKGFEVPINIRVPRNLTREDHDRYRSPRK